MKLEFYCLNGVENKSVGSIHLYNIWPDIVKHYVFLKICGPDKHGKGDFIKCVISQMNLSFKVQIYGFTSILRSFASKIEIYSEWMYQITYYLKTKW